MRRDVHSRASDGLMVSELVFLLLIIGVLGALVFPVLLQMSRSSERPTDTNRHAVHQASSRRSLGYVRKRSEETEELLAVTVHSSGERRMERRPPASEASRPSAAPPSEGTAAADAVAAAAATGAAAASRFSKRGASDGPAGTPFDTGSPEDSSGARSTLVASASGSRASPVHMESRLEVTVTSVTGEGQAAAAPAGAGGSGAASGVFLVGGGPRPEGRRQDAERHKDAAGSSGTLLLVGMPSGVDAPRVESEMPANWLVPVVDQAEGGPGHHGSRAARGLEFHTRGRDVWKRWPDVNARNIVGAEGMDTLDRAFDLLEDSDARAIADDLFRKGISISFGEPSEFSGDHTHAAEFSYPATRPPDPPQPPPTLRINPKFLYEDPRVLAAVLAHEGTHFQQYLDGTLQRGSTSVINLEAPAWLNGAVMWQQVRRSALLLKTPLVRDLEVGYQVARQGEGLLRDFVAALYNH